jgi:ABC-type multidrug transport system fused ATPase/permease subunit
MCLLVLSIFNDYVQMGQSLVTEFQVSFPDAEVREGGENLSVGERQLFCLARAILHNAACLVMDDATSSVEPSTEKALLAAATKAFAGKTVITIAVSIDTFATCPMRYVYVKRNIVW